MDTNKNEQNKTKKIVGIVVNVILWLFVAFAVFVTVIAVSASANKKNVPVFGGKCYLNVQSNSMNAPKPDGVPAGKPDGFASGDMIVGKYIVDDEKAIAALEVGDIISYEWNIGGKRAINTHRIVKINKADGKIISFDTMGDNPEFSKNTSETVSVGSVIAVYTGNKVGGLGAMMTFLGSQLGFGLCILLPLVAFFVYQLVIFIKTVVQVKNADKRVITAEDEELIRQRAIEEYLRQQAAVQNCQAQEQTTTEEQTGSEDNK